MDRAERRRRTRKTRKAIRHGLGDRIANDGGSAAWVELIRNVGVVSFAGRSNDMLMWGYYADSHRGYCVEFATDELPLSLAHRVIYRDDRPIYRPLDRDRSRGLMERAILRKAKFWEHEQEYRIATPNHVGSLNFPSKSLKSIILGANISREDEASLRLVIEDKSDFVSIKRARLDAKTYRLHIDEEA